MLWASELQTTRSNPGSLVRSSERLPRSLTGWHGDVSFIAEPRSTFQVGSVPGPSRRTVKTFGSGNFETKSGSTHADKQRRKQEQLRSMSSSHMKWVYVCEGSELTATAAAKPSNQSKRSQNQWWARLRSWGKSLVRNQSDLESRAPRIDRTSWLSKSLKLPKVSQSNDRAARIQQDAVHPDPSSKTPAGIGTIQAKRSDEGSNATKLTREKGKKKFYRPFETSELEIKPQKLMHSHHEQLPSIDGSLPFNPENNPRSYFQRKKNSEAEVFNPSTPKEKSLDEDFRIFSDMKLADEEFMEKLAPLQINRSLRLE